MWAAMSLERALNGLLVDRAAETTVRAVVQMLARHPGEWLRAGEIARQVERPEPTVAVILSRLAGGFVLLSDGERYRLDRDPVVDLDVKRFLQKSEHSQLAQDNLAKFRDRFGHH
jgi:DNA-binding IclR family transcriptional regulator